MTDAVIDLLANTEAIAVNQQFYKHPVVKQPFLLSLISISDFHMKTIILPMQAQAGTMNT